LLRVHSVVDWEINGGSICGMILMEENCGSQEGERKQENFIEVSLCPLYKPTLTNLG
jgi:hypothetical protein